MSGIGLKGSTLQKPLFFFGITLESIVTFSHLLFKFLDKSISLESLFPEAAKFRSGHLCEDFEFQSQSHCFKFFVDFCDCHFVLSHCCYQPFFICCTYYSTLLTICQEVFQTFFEKVFGFVIGIISHCFSLGALVHIYIPQTDTPCGEMSLAERSYLLSWAFPFFRVAFPHLCVLIIAHF